MVACRTLIPTSKLYHKLDILFQSCIRRCYDSRSLHPFTDFATIFHLNPCNDIKINTPIAKSYNDLPVSFRSMTRLPCLIRSLFKYHLTYIVSSFLFSPFFFGTKRKTFKHSPFSNTLGSIFSSISIEQYCEPENSFFPIYSLMLKG